MSSPKAHTKQHCIMSANEQSTQLSLPAFLAVLPPPPPALSQAPFLTGWQI